jgi:hypothetical protein
MEVFPNSTSRSLFPLRSTHSGNLYLFAATSFIAVAVISWLWINQSSDPKEPPQLYSKLPIIGHLLGMLHHEAEYFVTLRQEPLHLLKQHSLNHSLKRSSLMANRQTQNPHIKNLRHHLPRTRPVRLQKLKSPLVRTNSLICNRPNHEPLQRHDEQTTGETIRYRRLLLCI